MLKDQLLIPRPEGSEDTSAYVLVATKEIRGYSVEVYRNGTRYIVYALAPDQSVIVLDVSTLLKAQGWLNKANLTGII